MSRLCSQLGTKVENIHKHNFLICASKYSHSGIIQKLLISPLSLRSHGDCKLQGMELISVSPLVDDRSMTSDLNAVFCQFCLSAPLGLFRRRH